MAAAESDRTTRGFAVPPGAATVVGVMVTNPSEWLESQQPLATWGAGPDEGEEAGAAEALGVAGSLTAGIVARYMFFLPPESLSELAGADAEARTRFVRDLGTRELRLADATARGLTLDPAAARDYARLHQDEIEYWTNALELAGPDAPSRDALARHMESLVSRREEARSLPPLLEAWLLARTESRVRERGVLAAIVLARGMLTEAGGTTGNDP